MSPGIFDHFLDVFEAGATLGFDTVVYDVSVFLEGDPRNLLRTPRSGPYTAQKDKFPGPAGMGIGAHRLWCPFTIGDVIVHQFPFRRIQD